jgi:hypothetical protein
MAGDMNVFLENEDLGLLRGTVSNEGKHQNKLVLRTQPDGTLRAHSPLILVDQYGREIGGLAEDDGTMRSQTILWDYTGAAQIRAAGEPATGQAMVSLYGTNVTGNLQAIENEDTGELRVVQMGADEAANIDRFRTDPNRIQWTRPYEEYVTVPSAEIPVAEGDLWAPGAADAVRYLVEFMVVNNDAGAAAIAGVYVGRDLNAGGALAAPEYWMFDETIPYPGTSGWRGPFYMHGDDAVRGVAGVANDASIHFRVKRVDTGA